MEQGNPKNWPKRWIYSPESIGVGAAIAILRLALSSPHPEDQNKITPCIEKKKSTPT